VSKDKKELQKYRRQDARYIRHSFSWAIVIVFA
jgi:hypothetical protein